MMWLASAIDGEGSICINEKTNRIQITVNNTNREYVTRAHRLMSGSGLASLKSRIFVAHLADKLRILVLLSHLIPFLMIKRARAEQVVRYIIRLYHLNELPDGFLKKYGSK